MSYKNNHGAGEDDDEYDFGDGTDEYTFGSNNRHTKADGFDYNADYNDQRVQNSAFSSESKSYENTHSKVKADNMQFSGTDDQSGPQNSLEDESEPPLTRKGQAEVPRHQLGFTQNEECGFVTIESTWRSSMHTSHSNCQTDEIEQFNEAVQTVESSCAATQTEAEEDPGLNEACTGFSGWNPTNPSLRNFLLSASKTIETQLKLSSQSLAFDDFDNVVFDDGKFCAQKYYHVR